VPSDRDLIAGDVRTLSFASIRIEEELLQRLLRYQRALADRLRPGWEPAVLSRAHQEALAEAGLEADQLERPLAVLRRFAGNRTTAARLRQRIEAATGELAEGLREQLHSLDRQLREREDPGTVERMLAHEAEILALHSHTDQLIRG
jgi:hypothetical protein